MIRDNTKPEPVKPTLAMLMMVEKAILDAEDYMTKATLFDTLEMDYQAFLEIMEHLEKSGQIVFDEKVILWIGDESPRFRAMLDRCILVDI